MHKFTFYDVESVWDEHLHESYREIDPAAQPHVRMASKRIFAAAAFDLTLSDDGNISCERISSWTQYDHGDEEAVVRGLFDHLRANPDRVAAAFGSVAVDLPLLTLAAMEYGLTLPAQLLQRKHFPRSGPIRPHLDLGLSLKGSGKTWTHLSEVLIRLGLPSQLMEGKKRVDFPTDPAGWLAARAHCELDTALLAIATMAWQRTQGQCNVDPQIASFVILDWLRRNRPLTQAMQDKLAAICLTVADEISNRLMRAA
ncbi:hypothetical protein [Blastomonas fulva]|jgi:hypothetical protein|uniref:hypothetical protein n=1 Tax=Blastomonas fulva TaxID=1550728 RepID=UPI003D2806BA